MAGKRGTGKVKVVVVDKDEIDDQIDFDDDTENDDQPSIKEMDFESALAQFEDDDDYKVFAHETADGKIDGAYLFSEPVKGFKLDNMMDRVRGEYGSGNYRAVLKKNGRVIRGQSFSIKLSRAQQAAFDAAPVKQNGNTAQPDSSMTLILAMMQNQNKQQHDLMMAMMSGNKSAAQPSSMNDVIDAVSKLHGMAKPTEAAVSKVDPLEMFLKGVTFAKDTVTGGEESVLQTAIKEIAPFLGDLVKNQGQQQVSPSVPRGTQRETEALPAPAAQPSEFDALIKMLCRAAANDADPLVYAELVMDQLTDEKAVQLCQSEVGYGIFVQKLPPELYAVKKEWFDALRAAVIASVTDTETGDDGDSSESGEQE